MNLRTRPFDLSAAIEDAVKAVSPAAGERGVSLEVEIPGTAVRFVGDPGRIQQVLWNLLTNAIKFSPEGSGVTTRLHVDESAATITVEDHGEGISRESLRQIFDELRQEEKGERAGGLGLGLFIVRTIVTLHGGTIEAHSDGPGRGATFVVSLPLHAQGHEPGGSAAPATPPDTGAVSSAC
ncbi:MAG TPA: HAMP domain-containing sensor histidine kinase [Thermoanaerobaculia bacterium]|nr:HAMP domain-containing sensor histidine kinase [Thermoanaerobaculia bacterium]